MALTVRVKTGMVLSCDFSGYILPEIVKTRPVVVISPNEIVRPDLFTVVPLSKTAPNPVRDYHYQLKSDPFQVSTDIAWAKCDLSATVCYDRLDRWEVRRRQYIIGRISAEEVRSIRICVAKSIGLDIAPKKH